MTSGLGYGTALASRLPVAVGSHATNIRRRAAGIKPSRDVQQSMLSSYVHTLLTRDCDTQELMAAGPDAVHAVVERILAQARASGNAAGNSVPAAHGAPGNAEGGLHNLAPLGARLAADAATVHRTGIPPDQSMSSYEIRLHHVWCMSAGPSVYIETHPEANFISHIIIIAEIQTSLQLQALDCIL